MGRKCPSFKKNSLKSLKCSFRKNNRFVKKLEKFFGTFTSLIFFKSVHSCLSRLPTTILFTLVILILQLIINFPKHNERNHKNNFKFARKFPQQKNIKKIQENKRKKLSLLERIKMLKNKIYEKM